MNKFIMLFMFSLPITSNAQCWVVGNLKGYGAISTDSYQYTEDAISSGRFKVSIDGDKAALQNAGNSLVSGDLSYVGMSPTTMVGFYRDNEVTTVETWSITTDNKVLYTKVINSPANFNSSKSFIGDVLTTCQ
ncbi:hypothetical protein [Hafnia paralvei]|uniref:hypothetical protein n=1 Tax=Hafnia paralvei TaxID=546367 RepID=UPI0027B92F14|nr:hypothetical protein [Hafnia paralvei]